MKHVLVSPLAALVFAAAPARASIVELLGPELVTADGRTVETSSLQGKVIALYFSAGWCGPCVRFTPVLVRMQEAHKEDFEVVFVSFDRTAEAMEDYMRQSAMPWPAIPYDSPRRSALRKEFEVRGIPRVIIVDDQGRTLDPNARSAITEDPGVALQRWKSTDPSAGGDDKPFSEIEEQTLQTLEKGFEHLRQVHEATGELVEKVRGFGSIFGIGDTSPPQDEAPSP